MAQPSHQHNIDLEKVVEAVEDIITDNTDNLCSEKKKKFKRKLSTIMFRLLSYFQSQFTYNTSTKELKIDINKHKICAKVA